MIIEKRISGTVIQTFDTDKNRFTDQRFVEDEPVEHCDAVEYFANEDIDEEYIERLMKDKYMMYTMLQPHQKGVPIDNQKNN